jgi:3-isopropylmalate dehydratase small subunit
MFTLRSALVRQDAPLPFIVREERRQALLNGWDDTAMILNQWGEAIDRFEARQQRVQPWLYHR